MKFWAVTAGRGRLLRIESVSEFPILPAPPDLRQREVPDVSEGQPLIGSLLVDGPDTGAWRRNIHKHAGRNQSVAGDEKGLLYVFRAVEAAPPGTE